MVVTDALRQTVAHGVFDYQTLLTVLSDYAHPRDKITNAKILIASRLL